MNDVKIINKIPTTNVHFVELVELSFLWNLINLYMIGIVNRIIIDKNMINAMFVIINDWVHSSAIILLISAVY